MVNQVAPLRPNPSLIRNNFYPAWIEAYAPRRGEHTGQFALIVLQVVEDGLSTTASFMSDLLRRGPVSARNRKAES
jgi:hypothetical protein